MNIFNKLGLYSLLLGMSVGVSFVAQAAQVPTEEVPVEEVRISMPKMMKEVGDTKKTVAMTASIGKKLARLKRDFASGKINYTPAELNRIRLRVRGIITLIDQLEKYGAPTDDLLNQFQQFVQNLGIGSGVNTPFVQAVADELSWLAGNYAVYAEDPKSATRYNIPYAKKVAAYQKGLQRKGPSVPLPMAPSNEPARKIHRRLQQMVNQ